MANWHDLFVRFCAARAVASKDTGDWPKVGLKEARDMRDEAKRLLDGGQDPALARQEAKAAKAEATGSSFEAMVGEYLAKKRRDGIAETTLGKLDWIFGLALPALGQRPILEITPAEILRVLKQVEARGQFETAGRLCANIGAVFRYAVALGNAENDPTLALRNALATPKTKHRAAIVDPRAFGGLLRAIDGYEGTPEVRCALHLLALTFVRPGELRNAEWRAFDLDMGVWSIPAGRMKMRRPHKVPLAPQAVAIFRQLHAITGHRALLFPGVRSAERAMSENTINAALRRLGYRRRYADQLRLIPCCEQTRPPIMPSAIERDRGRPRRPARRRLTPAGALASNDSEARTNGVRGRNRRRRSLGRRWILAQEAVKDATRPHLSRKASDPILASGDSR